MGEKILENERGDGGILEELGGGMDYEKRGREEEEEHDSEVREDALLEKKWREDLGYGRERRKSCTGEQWWF